MDAAMSMGQLGLATVTSGAPQALLGATAVGTVLFLEVPWRVAGVRIGEIGVKQCVRTSATFLCRCAPEVLGLSVVLFMALLLRLRGDTEVMPDPASQQVWEQIKVEWPILMGADTLLNLQAMLRLLVLLFVAIRAEAGGRSPLSGMAALLSLAGALTRGMLTSRTDVYRLEGPLALGGDLPAFCELAGIPFWSALGFRALRRAPIKASLAVSAAIWFASHHYLNLAKDATVDRLFLQAHVLELFASFAYAARAFTLMVTRGSGEDTDGDERGRRLVEKSDWRGTPFVGFMHVLMMLQQALSAYYFLTAFEPHPSLVGAGRPFCVLIGGNLLQLGAYLCAAALFVGGCVDVDLQVNGNELEEEVATTELQDGTLETEVQEEDEHEGDCEIEEVQKEDEHEAVVEEEQEEAARLDDVTHQDVSATCQ